MLSVHCPRHRSEVLLTEGQIVGIDRSADHLTVRWVCWCGYRGSLRAGRQNRPPAAIV